MVVYLRCLDCCCGWLLAQENEVLFMWDVAATAMYGDFLGTEGVPIYWSGLKDRPTLAMLWWMSASNCLIRKEVDDGWKKHHICRLWLSWWDPPIYLQEGQRSRAKKKKKKKIPEDFQSVSMTNCWCRCDKKPAKRDVQTYKWVRTVWKCEDWERLWQQWPWRKWLSSRSAGLQS